MDSSSYLTLGLFLLVSGILLLLLDLLFASGVMLALGMGSMVVGLAFLFRYDVQTGTLTLIGLVLFAPVGLWLAGRWFPYTPIGRSVLVAEDIEEFHVGQALQHLKGKHGKTLTQLHPAGMVDFDGQRVDSITEGRLIEPGTWVRCIEVRGNTVVVRPSDGPRKIDLETTELH